MKLYLIRHSITEGNLHKRYIGATNQPLCREGVDLVLEKKARGEFDSLLEEKDILLISSPLTRCQETLKLLFPEHEYTIIDDLRECDFGLFENKNYLEMADLPQYQEWVDSGGTLPFPEGETVEGFNKRCEDGFLKAMKICQEKNVKAAALFVHGGTLMAVMDAFADSEKTYYDFMVPNAEGYQGVYRDGKIREFSKLNRKIRC